MSQFLNPKRKIENTLRPEIRSRRRRCNFMKPAGAGETHMELTKKQIVNSDEQTDSLWVDFDVLDDCINEDDIQLQQILFYSAQFHSVKSLDSRSNHAAGKKVLETQYSVIYGSINTENSIREKGESSCTFCEICDDAKPPNTLKQGSSCRHYYCEECIRKYIAEKVDEDIHEVKCPVSNCKRILDLESLMPKDFLVRVNDAIRETKVLISPLIIECPFWSCTGRLVDDRRGFLIRICPKCGSVFCVNCGYSHFGMTCAAYKQLQIRRQLKYFFWQSRGDDDDDDEQQQEEDNERDNSTIKVLSILGKKV